MEVIKSKGSTKLYWNNYKLILLHKKKKFELWNYPVSEIRLKAIGQEKVDMEANEEKQKMINRGYFFLELWIANGYFTEKDGVQEWANDMMKNALIVEGLVKLDAIEDMTQISDGGAHFIGISVNLIKK